MTVGLSYALLVAWLALELVLRRGHEAKDWSAGAEDRSTTRLLIGTYVIAAILPRLLRSVAVVSSDSVVAWVGIAVGAAGLALRIWAMQTLGRSFTRTLRTSPDQAVVTAGPYRLVRHPGYLGSLLVWFGSRLALNWLAAVITAIGLAVVLVVRIRAEEAMLARDMGDSYADYQRRTRRLVPFLW